MTQKHEQWKSISYRLRFDDGTSLLVHKGSSRYSRWYVVDDSGQDWKYLSQGVNTKEAAFVEARQIHEKGKS